MKDAAEMIVRPQEHLSVVSVNPGDGSEQLLKELTNAVEETDDGDGVLVLTDLFGGTPTNIGCTLLDNKNIEVVTGFNLPLLIKAITARGDTKSVVDLAKMASDYGRRHISIAGELLAEGHKD